MHPNIMATVRQLEALEFVVQDRLANGVLLELPSHEMSEPTLRATVSGISADDDPSVFLEVNYIDAERVRAVLEALHLKAPPRDDVSEHVLAVVMELEKLSRAGGIRDEDFARLRRDYAPKARP